MRWRHVQGVEVEPFGFDLWALCYLVTHANKELADAFLKRRQRMASPPRPDVSGSGDVNSLVDQDPRVAVCLELMLSGLERPLTRGPRGSLPLPRLRSRL